MYKNQKSVRGGIEDVLCPFADMYITCAAGESQLHKGTMAIDVRGAEPGVRYPYYAPCTVKCIKIYPESGQSMWQSIDKVRCSNGYIGIITFMICHSDSQDCHVGQIVSQGMQLDNMGTKGNATGVHCHIEFEQGSDISWTKNIYGNYCFNSEVDIEDVCFMDETNIWHGYGNWKYLEDVPAEAVDQILHKGSVVRLTGQYIVKDINVPDNMALIEIDGHDTWISSTPLEEL